MDNVTAQLFSAMKAHPHPANAESYRVTQRETHRVTFHMRAPAQPDIEALKAQLELHGCDGHESCSVVHVASRRLGGTGQAAAQAARRPASLRRQLLFADDASGETAPAPLRHRLEESPGPMQTDVHTQTRYDSLANCQSDSPNGLAHAWSQGDTQGAGGCASVTNDPGDGITWRSIHCSVPGDASTATLYFWTQNNKQIGRASCRERV